MAAVKKTTKQNGYGEKQTVRVITVDKERRRVECSMRDGAMIWAAVWETDTVFRWPEVGEIWTVRQDTGVWRLDKIVQSPLAEEESSATPKALENLPEGDTRIIGNTVHVQTLIQSDPESLASSYFLTGDFDSVQDALAQAASNGGGTVLLSAHTTFDLSSPLIIPNYVHLLGHGATTKLRATGNNFCVAFDGGAYSTVSNLSVEAQTKQISGGGFDYRKALPGIELDKIIFGNKLKTGVFLAPEAGGFAPFWLNRLRWNGVTESGTAIQLGDGTHLITDIYCSQIVGTGSTTGDMLEWLKINSAVDTLKMSDSLFITGKAGVVGNGHPTNVKFRNVTTDNMSEIGWNFTGGGWEIECAGCEASASGGEGLNIGAEMRIFRWVGGAIQNGQANGAIIRAGAQDVTITGAAICDNNQSNGGNNHGIFVPKNTTDFTITDNTIGNGRRVTEAGHQKRPVFVEKGTSDRYVISHNRFVGNDLVNLKDEGEGEEKLVNRNIES